MLLVPVLLAVYATTNCNCERWQSLHPAFNLVKEAIDTDPVMMFKIRQIFFPATNFRYWQVDGVEVVLFFVCVKENWTLSLDNVTTAAEESPTEHDSNGSCKDVWGFQWTNSLLLNLIPGDILLAMDPMLSNALYSDICYHTLYRTLWINLHLNLSSNALDDYEQAFALFLSMVSIQQLLNHSTSIRPI